MLMILLTICAFLSLVMSLALCLCWKRTSKEEWQGVDGMVTQKNPDENVNHLPSVINCSSDATQNGVDAGNKSVATTNTRRSLPDIPSTDVENGLSWEPTADNSSGHYATVGQYPNTNKRHTLNADLESKSKTQLQPGTSKDQYRVTRYERVKYEQINSKEHPYAQVHPVNRTSSSDHDENEDNLNTQRKRRSLSIESNSSPPRNSSNELNIPAASAVAGSIAASPELPYMTPPVPQINFSGDSQDSSKGYTSISVREPLANILAQTKRSSKKRELDPHYSTVSDDSDDVYTTIPDPNQIYTSESETYARIPASPILVEAEINQVSQDSDLYVSTEELYEAAPQPLPSTGEITKHSRQASTSSSIVNVGSPKPEKRQANSPLPPTPGIDPTENPLEKLTVLRNLDDLYAKVNKNKRKDDDEKVVENTSNSLTKYFNKEHNYETLRKTPKKSCDPNYERIKNEEPGYASINGPESVCSSDPGYEVLKKSRDVDPNYEELRSGQIDSYSAIDKASDDSRTSSEPNYESVPSGSETDPNYESVRYLRLDPPYKRVDEDSSRADSEVPGYERVNEDSSRGDSEVPGYERIKGRGYESIDTSDSLSCSVRETSDGVPYEKLRSRTDSDMSTLRSIRDLKEHASSTESSSSARNTSDPSSSDLDHSSGILDDNAIFQV